MKIKYVSLSKPIQIEEFEKSNAPMGWFRLEYLLKNKELLKKLTKEEIKILNKNK